MAVFLLLRTRSRWSLDEVSNALTLVLGWLDNARIKLDGAALEPVDVARAHASLGHAIARRRRRRPVSDGTELRSALVSTRHGTRCEPIA